MYPRPAPITISLSVRRTRAAPTQIIIVICLGYFAEWCARSVLNGTNEAPIAEHRPHRRRAWQYQARAPSFQVTLLKTRHQIGHSDNFDERRCGCIDLQWAPM